MNNIARGWFKLGMPGASPGNPMPANAERQPPPTQTVTNMFEKASPIVTDLSRVLQEIIGILPEALAALVVLLIGWLVAKAMKILTLRSAGLLNRGLAALGTRVGTQIGSLRDASLRTIAGVVYWLVILFFLAAATSILGLSMFAGWIDRIVASLPSIFSGVFIIFAGVILSNIARDTVEAIFGTLPENQRFILARSAQVATLTLLAIVGFDQIGVDVTVITTVLAIVLACLLGGLSIAFSLGARTFVSNLIGAHYLGKDCRPGETLRIAGIEGTVVAITAVSVVLDSADGRITIPARLFSEEPVLHVSGDEKNG